MWRRSAFSSSLSAHARSCRHFVMYPQMSFSNSVVMMVRECVWFVKRVWLVRLVQWPLPLMYSPASAQGPCSSVQKWSPSARRAHAGCTAAGRRSVRISHAWFGVLWLVWQLLVWGVPLVVLGESGTRRDKRSVRRHQVEALGKGNAGITNASHWG